MAFVHRENVWRAIIDSATWTRQLENFPSPSSWFALHCQSDFDGSFFQGWSLVTEIIKGSSRKTIRSEEVRTECLFIPLYAPSSSWLIRDSGKTSQMKGVGPLVINQYWSASYEPQTFSCEWKGIQPVFLGTCSGSQRSESLTFAKRPTEEKKHEVHWLCLAGPVIVVTAVCRFMLLRNRDQTCTLPSLSLKGWPWVCEVKTPSLFLCCRIIVRLDGRVRWCGGVGRGGRSEDWWEFEGWLFSTEPMGTWLKRLLTGIWGMGW